MNELSDYKNKLNDNCEYKNNKWCSVWDEYEISNGRSYCFWHYTTYKLCNSCKRILDQYEGRLSFDIMDIKKLSLNVEKLSSDVQLIKLKLGIN